MTFEPSTLDLERSEATPPPFHNRGNARARRIPWGALAAWLVTLGTVAVVIVAAYQATRVEVEQTDLADGAVLGGVALEELEAVRIELPSSDDAEAATLSFNDEPVEDPDIDGSVIIWAPPEDLAEDEHVLALSVPRLVLGPARFEWRFEVDTTPPDVDVASVVERVAMDEAVSVDGSTEPDVELSTTAGQVGLEEDGSFRLDLPRPPAGPVTLTAVDRAGNVTTAEVIVPVRYPSTRSVFVSATGWAEPHLRARVLALADQGRIDAVHLDLKDADGTVSFDTTVDHAQEIGAVNLQYRLDDVVEALLDKDVRVIGRVVAFFDPTYAEQAWAAGDHDHVVQASPGDPYGSSASYTNLAHPAVQDYNLDIALDAVERGVEEIVWEGVRPPGDGEEELIIPGFDGAAVDASSGFLARAHAELRRRGAYQGTASTGLTIHSPAALDNLAQMARHVDYVMPIIEPVNWNAGELDVANPQAQPAEFVAAYVARISETIEGSGADIKPHLQDFSYSEDQVRAQVNGAQNAGADSFMLYSPDISYSATALG